MNEAPGAAKTEGSITTRRAHRSELSLGEAHSTVLKAWGSAADHQLFPWYLHQGDSG